MRQGGDLVTNRRPENVADVVALFCGVVTSLCSFFQRPVKTCGETRCADKPRRVFQKRIILQDTDQLRFQVCDTVEWIKKKATGPFIQRKCHRIDGEVRRRRSS